MVAKETDQTSSAISIDFGDTPTDFFDQGVNLFENLNVIDKVRIALGVIFAIGFIIYLVGGAIYYRWIPSTYLGKERTTALACQRLEPSLAVTCEQKYYPCGYPLLCREMQRSFELLGASGSAWVLLYTNEGPDSPIYLFREGASISWSEADQAIDAINDFANNPEEVIHYVSNSPNLNLIIEDGRLTYEWEAKNLTAIKQWTEWVELHPFEALVGLIIFLAFCLTYILYPARMSARR
jgi:hypothetical protein